MGQYDITIASANPSPTFTTTSFRVEPDAMKQDITPASARRSDGDTRFLTIQTESFYEQGDWGGGYGLLYPPDPTSYQDGPVDLSVPHRLRAAWAPTALTLSAGAKVVAMCQNHDNSVFNIFAITTDGGANHALVYRNGGAWTVATTLGAVPLCLASFRGKLWIGYGTAASVQTWDGTTLATPAPNFKAYELRPFGSMLFYLFADGVTLTWRLNRYDPENTTAISDLAIFPYQFAATENTKMAALGQDLYILLANELWKFTSATGNSGVLAGPLDRFAPRGGPGAYKAAGSCLVVFQGGLFYSSGSWLRRYYPGGQAKTVWPDPGRTVTPGQTYDDDIWGLEVAEDALWLLATRSVAPGSTYAAEPCRLLRWDGLGMHHVGSLDGVWSSSLPGGSLGACLCSDGNGTLAAAFRHTVNPTTSGLRSGYFKVGGAQGRLYLQSSVWKSALLDFGMIDIQKALSQIGLAAIVPVGQDLQVSVAVDGAAAVVLTKQGSFSTTFPTVVYFTPPSGRVLVGKIFELRITWNLGAATSATSPEVWAILGIPNPVNPLRRGFRFTLLLDEGAVDHNGGKLYADSAAVTTALALARQLRTEAHPLLLTWLDGTQYYIRVNTETERLVHSIAGQFQGWRVVCDAQEIT